MIDILERLANSSCNESSHELQCRCFDAAEEVSRLRAALQTQAEEASKLTTQREELLAALKRVLPEISVCCSTEMLEQCREAIANATT